MTTNKMENNYISAPSQFRHVILSSCWFYKSFDLTKTFELDGISNDEMLRLYLRKAGLSDEIECLSPEQRREFIYDIVKKKSSPGYWTPSTAQTTSFSQQTSATCTPSPLPACQNTNTVMIEDCNRPTSPTHLCDSINSSFSSDSLTSMDRKSQLMSQSSALPKNVPTLPSTVVKDKKGLMCEISGPINFMHISGDITRDITKSAFDLTPTMNDNVLNSYLIERGITDNEIAGMHKKDLIRKIVQSNYTWMPPRHKEIYKNDLF